MWAPCGADVGAIRWWRPPWTAFFPRERLHSAVRFCLRSAPLYDSLQKFSADAAIPKVFSALEAEHEHT